MSVLIYDLKHSQPSIFSSFQFLLPYFCLGSPFGFSTYQVRTFDLPLGSLEAHAWCLSLPQCRVLRYLFMPFAMTLQQGTYWMRTFDRPLGLLEAHAWCLSLPQCRALRYLLLSFVMTLQQGKMKETMQVLENEFSSTRNI